MEDSPTPSPALSAHTGEAAGETEAKRQITPDIIKVIIISGFYQCCGSASAWIRNFCLDPDPELKFQIQQKVKEHINKTVNSGLFVLFVLFRIILT